MITFLFLFLAAVCIGIYFWNSNRQSAPSGNRYCAKKRIQKKPSRSRYQSSLQHNESIESRLSAKEPVLKDNFFDDEQKEEFEDVLGLQPKYQKSSSPSVKSQDEIKSDRVIVLYLMAEKNAPFLGYELLQILLSAGLRYGNQQIFHRHANKDGRGAVLFHCASAKMPGTFDLTKMGSTMCEGLSCFFSADDVDDPVAAFDCLLETVDQLVEDLGGKVFDADHKLLTTEKMLQMRDALRVIEVL